MEGRQREIHTHRQTHGWRNDSDDRQTDRQISKQTDKRAYRRKERVSDERQTDRHDRTADMIHR